MKLTFHVCVLLFAVATASAAAETRMQVAAASTPIFAQPSASARKIGSASSGEILFVSRIEGDWAAISPPDRLDVWLNKDFIEGNRVLAKSIQIRSGPGIQYDVVGTLERGAPVMPRGEEGDWCKIAPPSSTTLWVKKSDLSEVRPQTTPIREVATVATPVPPPPPPVAEPKPEPPPAVAQAQPAPQPAPAPAASTKVAPSIPNAAAPQATSRPTSVTASAPAATVPMPGPMASAAAPARPVVEPMPSSASAPKPAVLASESPVATPRPKPPVQPQAPVHRATVPISPALRPATAIPGTAPHPATARPVAPRTPPPVHRAPAMPAVSHPVPTTASTVAAQKSKDVGVQVDQALVDELDLADLPNQGKPVQVEGELRNAPFMAASPSRYRLLDEDEDGFIEMVCHIHGDSKLLRQYIGQGVSIRGREYWVEESDMPVVVVGQIVPLAPAYEPVMF